ncbi:MAG: YraN family protein [Candidatus Pacebacteria bacterium]|nr:YraN family protein [Candidatus Paceibacterota bacterium]
MPKIFTSPSQKLGKLAEDAVAQYLIQKGFTILEQNYTRKWGEIDILAKGNFIDTVSRETKKSGREVLHFVEVKAVSRGTFSKGIKENTGEFRPEDNMHFNKVKRLKTTIESYLMSVRADKRHDMVSKRHDEDSIPWQFDLVIVYVDRETKKMIIEPFWNIIL